MFQHILCDAQKRLLRRVAERRWKFGQDGVHLRQAVCGHETLVVLILNALQDWECLGMRIVFGNNRGYQDAGVEKNFHVLRLLPASPPATRWS